MTDLIVESSEPIDERFRFYTDLELAAWPPLPPAIDGLLDLESVALVVGKYGSYKTFFALEMAFCIATGAPYYGRRVAPGVVLYFCAEGGRGIAKRVRALRAKYGYPLDVQEISLFILPRAIDVGDPAQLIPAIQSVDRRLLDLGMETLPISAVFIDTVARNMSGDENSKEAMNVFLAGCDLIKNRTGACVVVVHHTGWVEGRSRGHSSLPSGVDTEIILTKEDGGRLTVQHKKNRDGTETPDFVLEPWPTAGSIVLRAVAGDSPKLSPNEQRALTELQGGPGMRSSAWQAATGLAEGSYHNARRRLVRLAYVKQTGERYVLTDAGKLALSCKPATTCNEAANDASHMQLQAAPPLIGGAGLQQGLQLVTDDEPGAVA